MIQAIELVGGTPIARVPWNEPGIIGKVLDAGAHGVIVPMVNTREQAEAVVRSVALRARWLAQLGPGDGGHAPRRQPAPGPTPTSPTIPMIETAEAIANLDEILSVPGVDAIYVGPADLSISLGLEPGNNDGKPVVRRCPHHDRRRLPAARRGTGDPRQRLDHAGPPRAGFPDDHRHQRRARTPSRLHERARRGTRRRREGRARRVQAVLTTFMSGSVADATHSRRERSAKRDPVAAGEVWADLDVVEAGSSYSARTASP